MLKAIGRRRLAREIVRLLGEQPENRAHIIQMVAGYLVATKRANQAHLLVQDIADELYISGKHVSADVYQAFPAGTETDEAITTLLKQATGALSVELRHHQDPSLIGGVVVRTPRLELDASVKTQLKQIANLGVK